ncbi:MAG: hypothetical protein P8H98_03765, partial [Flavobacteriales bacterium]|nr:hypothetical protein [Flavobacteriales bacterium]
MHQKHLKLRSINDEEVQHSPFGLIGHFVSCFTQRLCISQSGERTPERFDEVSVWEVEEVKGLLRLIPTTTTVIFSSGDAKVTRNHSCKIHQTIPICKVNKAIPKIKANSTFRTGLNDFKSTTWENLVKA